MSHFLVTVLMCTTSQIIAATIKDLYHGSVYVADELHPDNKDSFYDYPLPEADVLRYVPKFTKVLKSVQSHPHPTTQRTTVTSTTMSKTLWYKGSDARKIAELLDDALFTGRVFLSKHAELNQFMEKHWPEGEALARKFIDITGLFISDVLSNNE